MSAPSKLALRGVVSVALFLLFACTTHLYAKAAVEGDHLVSPQALQQQVETSSATRQKNIETVTEFLSSPAADRAMRDAQMDPVQVRTAVPALSDEELANLSARATDAQQKFTAGHFGQFAAGHFGPGLLTIVVIAIAVIIIVAIVH
jgi:hypothetical protein